MKRMLKYPIPSFGSYEGYLKLSIPYIFHVGEQNGFLYLWCMVDSDVPQTKINVNVLATGGEILNSKEVGQYIGTVVVNSKCLVHHVFIKGLDDGLHINLSVDGFEITDAQAKGFVPIRCNPPIEKVNYDYFIRNPSYKPKLSNEHFETILVNRFGRVFSKVHRNYPNSVFYYSEDPERISSNYLNTIGIYTDETTYKFGDC